MENSEEKRIAAIKRDYYLKKESNRVGPSAKEIRDREFKVRCTQYIIDDAKKGHLGKKFFLAAFPQLTYYPGLIPGGSKLPN